MKKKKKEEGTVSQCHTPVALALGGEAAEV